MRCPNRSSIWSATLLPARGSIKETGRLTQFWGGLMVFIMKRQILFRALTFGILASALFLSSCSTTETRISGHPEIFQSLSPRDQALVRDGKIREGMSQDAVWLAWGTPDQKGSGTARGR